MTSRVGTSCHRSSFTLPSPILSEDHSRRAFAESADFRAPAATEYVNHTLRKGRRLVPVTQVTLFVMPRLTRQKLAFDASLAGLCRNCRLQHRRFASAAVPRPPASGLAQLPSRQLLSVAGPDALKFLQGIVTANLASKGQEGQPLGVYAGFLNATGRVIHDVFIYNDINGLGAPGGEGQSFLVEVDADQADRLAKYIKRYKLRAQVNLRKLQPDEVAVWQAWDDANGPTFSVPSTDTSQLILKDPRAPGLGYRILQAQRKPQIDLEPSTENAYKIRRYLTGVAEGQEELLRETALPQESNMDIMNGIDFHKGCYVGQELTIRTKHRGVVRKRVLPCMIYDKHSPAPSTLQYAAEPSEAVDAERIPTETSIGRFEKRGRSAGKWLKGVGNVGLALCRLEIMTDVALPGETAAAAFAAEDEFIMEFGEGKEEGVKVKAFVPDWLRAGLDAQR